MFGETNKKVKKNTELQECPSCAMIHCGKQCIHTWKPQVAVARAHSAERAQVRAVRRAEDADAVIAAVRYVQVPDARVENDRPAVGQLAGTGAGATELGRERDGREYNDDRNSSRERKRSEI